MTCIMWLLWWWKACKYWLFKCKVLVFGLNMCNSGGQSFWGAVLKQFIFINHWYHDPNFYFIETAVSLHQILQNVAPRIVKRRKVTQSFLVFHLMQPEPFSPLLVDITGETETPSGLFLLLPLSINNTTHCEYCWFSQTNPDRIIV